MLPKTLVPLVQGFTSLWSQQSLSAAKAEISFDAFEPLLQGAVPIVNLSSPLAAPRFVQGLNSTCGEQWAFDATSSDGSSGLLVGIYHDPTYAFLGPGNLRISIDAVWPNGSTWSHVDYLEKADIDISGQGTTGTWHKSNGACSYSFFVSGDNSYASLTFQSPEVQGSVRYHSTVPPRFPDGSTEVNSGTYNAPALEWAEVIPAAQTEVDLTFGGTSLSWRGIGGFERWWGGQGWLDVLEGWTAMRAVIGPYALTYWAPTSRVGNKTLYPSAFLARGGKRVFSATTNGPSLHDRKRPYVEYRGISDNVKLTGTIGHSGSNKAGTVKGYLISLVSPEENLRWEFTLEHKNKEFQFDLGNNNGGIAYVGTARGGLAGEDTFQGVFFNEWVDVTELKVPAVYTGLASRYYRMKAAIFGH